MSKTIDERLNEGRQYRDIDLGSFERRDLEDGRKVVRGKVDSLTSDVKLTPGKWVRLAVVYDLRTVRLFVDGAQAGAVLSPPARSAEFINHVVLGAKCGGLWNPTAHFRGDIREVRMYGRNLSPAEFLGGRR